MKLASIRIVTKDVPALTRFYEVLSQIAPVSPIGDLSVYAEIRVAGTAIAIADERGVEKFNAGAAVSAANRSTILEFEVSNVDAERDRLDAVVKEWVMEPTDMPWGNRSMLFRDPDLNLINLYAVIRK